jgi:hypothetical protein
MSKVYIAGPMTGMIEFNFPAFHEAAARWRAAGWEVLNPAESHGGRTDLPYQEYVEYDLRVLRTCDALALLPGWNGPNARGSVWEREVARNLLGIPIFDAQEVQDPMIPETVLEEAQRLVHGTRGADYGHPIEDYTRTGRIWGALLGIGDIDPRICCLMMGGVKMSREVNRHKRDNLTDLAGYAECASLIAERPRVPEGGR